MNSETQLKEGKDVAYVPWGCGSKIVLSIWMSSIEEPIIQIIFLCLFVAVTLLAEALQDFFFKNLQKIAKSSRKKGVWSMSFSFQDTDVIAWHNL